MILHSQPTLIETDLEAVTNVILSKHLEEGEIVEELETLFCNNFKKKHAFAVSNGFAAIHLSLIALGIKQDDEVIIPSYTCSALLNPILLLGGTPVIIDVEENSFNIDIKKLKNRITSKTKAIIVPHIFGFPAKIDEIISMNIPVIEDCAQSIGGKYKSRLLGSFGKLGVFSFYASKMITGGDGGMIITDDDNLAETIKNYRYYGHKKLHKFVAYNYHMTNLPASLIISQMNRLESFIAKRKNIASIYDSILWKRSDVFIEFQNKVESCYYRYPVKLNMNIDMVKAEMFNSGIQCGYGVLEGMHQMLNLPASNFNETEKNLKSILSLPIYPSLQEKDVYYISETLLKLIT